MKYTILQLQVPEGYEDQIKQLVMNRIEGILSYQMLSPKKVDTDAFNAEMVSISTQNKVAINSKFITK